MTDLNRSPGKATLVQRLRELHSEMRITIGSVAGEAADEIERLTAPAQRQQVPSDEWCDAYLKATGEWVEPYEPETECGVAIECGITQDDADQMNAESRDQIRKGYAAALAFPSTERS